MRKLKDKIIEFLGGIPRKQYQAELDISFYRGQLTAFKSILDFETISGYLTLRGYIEDEIRELTCWISDVSKKKL